MIVERKMLPFSGLGQETVVRPAVSYQEAFDAAFSTCAAMLGEGECRRMMGYIPFLCPPPAKRPIYTHPIFWLALGLIGGKVFS